MMLNMKPKAAMPKGMAEFYAFLDLAQNADEYRAKMDALAEQIARSEELVGVVDTLAKAKEHEAAAQKAKAEAADALDRARSECIELRAKAAEEYSVKRDEAIKLNLEAETYLKSAKERQQKATEAMERAEERCHEREDALDDREDELAAREEAIQVAEAELAEKRAKLNAIFG